MSARNIALGVVVLALLIAYPFLVDEYPVVLAVEVMAFGIFALGINLLLGYTGLVSLGHAMFLGLGGYGLGVFAVLLGWPVWLAILATVAVAAVVALAVGYVCTRTSGVEFLLITLAFSMMFYGVAVKTRATGGDDGMPGLPRPDLEWLGLDIHDVGTFYFYGLALTLITFLVVWRIINSPFGSVLVGIRENEKRMIALGYHVAWYKTLAFMISGMISSVGGILLAQKLYFVNPDIMSWTISGEGLLMVIMGGRFFFLGPIIGAGFFIIIKEQLSAITDEYIIFFGLFFMVVVALFRGGIAGMFAAVGRRLSPRAADSPDAKAGPR